MNDLEHYMTACAAATVRVRELEAEKVDWESRYQYWMHEALDRDSSGDERDAAVRALLAERDEARAEAAALKARKVKLPPRRYKNRHTVDGYSSYAEGHDDGIDACEEAIRAAGVEVEG